MATGLLQSLISPNNPTQSVAQSQLKAQKLSSTPQNMTYNTANGKTPTATNPSLGIKAVAPSSPSIPKTLTKAQTAPSQSSVSQYGPSNTNSTQNTTQNLPANVSVDNNTQAQNAAQYNNQTSPFNAAIGGLAGANMANKAITDQTKKEVDDTAANIANLRQGANTQEQAYQTGMTQPRAQGLAQNVASTEANQESALQGQLSNELAGGTQQLAGQAQTQSAQQAAGSLAAPNGNIINVDPTTGLPVAGGSLAQLAQTAGQVQGIQSGAAAQAAAGGQTAAQNAITTGTAPTNAAAQNTIALGTAATAANAKSIGDFTNQINTTQKSVATLNNLANQIVPNMTSTGFNPTSSPIGNQTFAQYFTEKNPAAKAGLVAGLGEIKNQISNVIASATGLTPTGVTAVTDAYDLTTLNPQQLHDFLNYIDQYAQSNLDAAQKSIQTIQSGGTVNANPSPLPVPSANSTGQASAATGAGIASQLISKIVSEAGNAVAGTVGGMASSILR